jgi:hypothetical protein
MTMSDKQNQEAVVYNDCGEKITIKKTGVSATGDHNFSIHHVDDLMDEDAVLTLSKDDKDVATVAAKISSAFSIAGCATSRQECTMMAKAILDMIN